MICDICGEPIVRCLCHAAGIDDALISEPGAPPPAEVRARAATVFARQRALAGVLGRARVPIDDTTACALIVLGVATLTRPTSVIDPQHVDTLVREMVALGRAAMRMMAIRARMQGSN